MKVYRYYVVVKNGYPNPNTVYGDVYTGVLVMNRKPVTIHDVAKIKDLILSETTVPEMNYHFWYVDNIVLLDTESEDIMHLADYDDEPLSKLDAKILKTVFQKDS